MKSAYSTDKADWASWLSWSNCLMSRRLVRILIIIFNVPSHFMNFIIKVFRTIVFIFIVISTTFWPICPPAFFRYLSNSRTFTELRTTSFIETMGVACSDSVSHNRVQVFLYITRLEDWTCNLQMIVSLEIIDRAEHWRIRHLKESAHILGYNYLLSRPSIEMNTIWEPIINKARYKKKKKS